MEHPDLDRTRALPPELRRRAIVLLRGALPSLPPTATPDEIAERDAEALEDVASLLPVNREALHLAVQFVSANLHAADLLGVLNLEPRNHLRQMAQVANMMRQSRGARSTLLRVQMERRICERLDAAARSFDTRDAKAGVKPPARPVTILETISRLSGNETTARHAEPAPAGLAPTRRVSIHETISHLAGNETPARRGSPASSAAASPDGLPPAWLVSGSATLSQPQASEAVV